VNILGKLMGKEDRAADIIKFFDAEVNRIYSKLPSGNGPTIYTELMSGPESYGNTSTYGYPEIDRIKGVNIAKFSPLGDAAGQISAEFLIAQNPDMIYLAASTFYGDKGGKMFGYGASPTDKDLADMAQEYMDRAGWNTLDAVKNKDVYFIYNMFRSNVECFTLLQQAAAWMYPEIFGDVDPEKSLSLFYEKFMPFELKGNWFYKVT
jgi:iron complex transport system substrate-binding protein